MNSTALALILFLSMQPDTVFVDESIPVVFTARVRGNSVNPPQEVRLMRLEGSGSESASCVFQPKPLPKGEPVSKDRLFTCTLHLKEKTQGMVSYSAVAEYADRVEPLRSRPVFITVVGNLPKKERKRMIKLQMDATQLYASLTQEKGLAQAHKEIVVWLSKQAGVASVRSMLNHDVAVQFNTGTTLWVKPPKGATVR